MLTILQTKKSIQEASINYEYADGKLIDYFLYTVKAEQAKLDYLIEKAKSKGLTLEITENANLKKGKSGDGSAKVSKRTVPIDTNHKKFSINY